MGLVFSEALQHIIVREVELVPIRLKYLLQLFWFQLQAGLGALF